MTEHVHEWHGSPFSTRFACLYCSEVLTLDQVAIRLNATERLSAEDARTQARHSETSQGNTPQIQALKAYADMREGK